MRGPANPPAHASSSTPKPLHVAIVGFGRLARDYYLPALGLISPDLRISIADPLGVSRNEARKRLPASSVFSDYRTMLHEQVLDAVLVSSPPSTHFDIWNECAERELPLFMEKPLLLPNDLKRVDPVSPDWSRLLMVDFNRRFWPPYGRLRNWVKEARIGRPLSAQFWLEVNVLVWSTVTSHRLDEKEGGALYDLGSQVLDLAGWIFDREPVCVTAQFDSRRWRNDHIQLTLDFPDDLKVTCHFGYGNRNRESVVIQGEEGQSWIDNPNFFSWCAPHSSKVTRANRKIADIFSLGYRAIFRDQSMLRYTVRISLERFFGSLRSGSERSPGFSDWVKVSRWLEAAGRSGETGQPVPIVD